MFWFLGREACGISAPRQGVEPIPPALEGEVLTTGPPGKSPILYIKFFKNHIPGAVLALRTPNVSHGTYA